MNFFPYSSVCSDPIIRHNHYDDQRVSTAPELSMKVDGIGFVIVGHVNDFDISLGSSSLLTVFNRSPTHFSASIFKGNSTLIHTAQISDLVQYVNLTYAHL